MTSNTIATAPTAELRQLDPAALVIDDNIRSQAQATITAAFIDSISEGVQQPILAVEVDGQVRVRDGQRRTLAAREAKLDRVPVYVVPVATDADDKAMTIGRIVDQFVSFEREELRASDRVSAIEQLSLAGMSATKIAKATRIKKKDVDNTLAIAKSSATLDLLDQGAGVTLEQSAVIAAYDHDPEAQQWLIRAASTGRFEHEVAQLESRADERAALLVEVAKHASEGIDSVTRYPNYQSGDARVEQLANADGTPAQIEDIPVGHRLAYVWVDVAEWWTDSDDNTVAEEIIDWDLEGEDVPADAQPEEGYIDPRTLTHHVENAVETTWYVTGFATLGLQGKRYDTSPRANTAAAEVSQAEKDALKAERRRVRVLNAASDTARGVRIEKLTTWLARKTLPKGSAPQIAKFIATSMQAHHDMFGANSMQGNAHDIATTILGGDPADQIEDAATADRVQIVALAIALAAREAHMWKDSWRNAADRNYPGSTVGARADYLRFLVEVLGYTLTEVEKVITGDTKAADVPLD